MVIGMKIINGHNLKVMIPNYDEEYIPQLGTCILITMITLENSYE